MNDLMTPFGAIRVRLNGQNIDYTFKELENIQHYLDDPNCERAPFFKVDKHYMIKPTLPEDIVVPFEVECFIELLDSVILDDRTEIEGGEHLIMQSMFMDNMKISIGGYDDLFNDDHTVLKVQGCNLPTGLSVELFDLGFLNYVRFGLAWVTLTSDDWETNEENYTWWAADPHCS